MNRLTLNLAAVTIVLAVSGLAQAAVHHDFVVTPSDLGDNNAWLSDVPFGHDHPGTTTIDHKPIGSFAKGGAPGFGDSSFWADVQGSSNPGGRDYVALRVAPHAVFGRDISNLVTVGELESISYFTNWVSGLNWQMKIYTAPDPGGSPSEWYKNRFNFERAADATGWNQTGTDTLEVDWIYTKATGDSDQTGYSWSTVQSNHGSEKIMWIDFIVGYQTSSPPGDSYLDGVELALSNGDTAAANLQAVPEPTTFIVWSLLGLIGACFARRRISS